MKNIFFDLDGTLTDPKVGITASIRYAMEKLGQSCPEDLDWCIGPPLKESFQFLLKNGDADKGVEFYRERYAEVGMYENVVYPGMADLLAKFSARTKLYVVTSKPSVFAKEIVRHFDLAKYFVEIYGSELDGTRADKGELIRYVLQRAPGRAVMIGDRKYDLIGAQKNQIEAVGVLWGYGSRAELEAVPSLGICESAAGLEKFLFPLL